MYASYTLFRCIESYLLAFPLNLISERRGHEVIVVDYNHQKGEHRKVTMQPEQRPWAPCLRQRLFPKNNLILAHTLWGKTMLSPLTDPGSQACASLPHQGHYVGQKHLAVQVTAQKNLQVNHNAVIQRSWLFRAPVKRSMARDKATYMTNLNQITCLSLKNVQYVKSPLSLSLSVLIQWIYKCPHTPVKITAFCDVKHKTTINHIRSFFQCET